jgi:oxygen-independent coproporphyrinogen-3 oxidase
MGLRIDQGVAFAELEPLGLTPASPVVADLVAQGLLTPGSDRLRATRSGRLVLDWLTGKLAVS